MVILTCWLNYLFWPWTSLLWSCLAIRGLLADPGCHHQTCPALLVQMLWVCIAVAEGTALLALLSLLAPGSPSLLQKPTPAAPWQCQLYWKYKYSFFFITINWILWKSSSPLDKMPNLLLIQIIYCRWLKKRKKKRYSVIDPNSQSWYICKTGCFFVGRVFFVCVCFCFMLDLCVCVCCAFSLVLFNTKTSNRWLNKRNEQTRMELLNPAQWNCG